MKNSSKLLRAGQIVLIKFPFTDLASQKVRPSLVVVDQTDDDILVVPISTTVNKNRDDILLNPVDYQEQPLPVTSCVRYKKLVTLNKNLIIKKVSELTPKMVLKINQKIVNYIKG